MKNLKELSIKDKTIYNDVEISVIPNKCFTIRTNEHSIKFYDLAQFFNFNKLDTAGEKFLGMKKEVIDKEIDITDLSLKRYESDIKYKFLMDKYLFQDVRITKLLADKLIDLTKPYINPKVFYSQASFSQQYFLENLKNKLTLPSKAILQYALNSYQGGRFEVFKKGFFEKSYIQDIKSAYPFHNIQVPNLTNGKWKKEKELDTDALIGLYKIDVNIHDLKISPLKYQLHNNLMIYPIGEFKDIHVNKSELELIKDLGYKYKINNCYQYYDDEPEYPYMFLKKFYDLKEKLKEDNKKELSWIPKIIINGFYGKLIQMNPKYEYTKQYKGDKNLYDINPSKEKELLYTYKSYQAGKLFNPIVANEITANTRTQLFKASMKNINNIIGFQTDSIISDKKLNLDYSNKIGAWEMEKEGSLIMLGSGIYQILAENPKIRLRGFSKNLDLHKLLFENKDKNEMQVTLKRNFKLKKTMKIKNIDDRIIDDTERMNMFNLIADDVKTININFDKKRVWDSEFKNCDDVLNNKIDSRPIII